MCTHSNIFGVYPTYEMTHKVMRSILYCKILFLYLCNIFLQCKTRNGSDPSNFVSPVSGKRHTYCLGSTSYRLFSLWLFVISVLLRTLYYSDVVFEARLADNF